MKPYPLRAIVTSNPQLPSHYNNHPESIDLISACLTPAQLEQLLDAGATFDTVLFVNGEGENLRSRLVPQDGAYDEALFPQVESCSVAQFDEHSVPVLHSALGVRRARGFFSVVGG